MLKCLILSTFFLQKISNVILLELKKLFHILCRHIKNFFTVCKNSLGLNCLPSAKCCQFFLLNLIVTWMTKMHYSTDYWIKSVDTLYTHKISHQSERHLILSRLSISYQKVYLESIIITISKMILFSEWQNKIEYVR